MLSSISARSRAFPGRATDTAAAAAAKEEEESNKKMKARARQMPLNKGNKGEEERLQSIHSVSRDFSI